MVGAGIRLELRGLSFADHRFGVLRSFAGLRRELLDDALVVGLRLLLHSSPLSLEALDFYLVICEFVVLILFHATGLAVPLAVEVLQVLPIFDVNSESLGYQESEPLKSLRVETNLGKRVLPVGNAEVHNHQSEIVGEGVGDEEPLAGEVLEPDLRLRGGASVHQGESTVLDIRVNIERVDVFSVVFRRKWLEIAK